MLHEAPQRIAGSGTTPIDRCGAVPVSVAGLRVDVGSADLYLDWPGRAGRRRWIASLGPDDVALPLSLTPPIAELPADARLLAFPGPGSRLSSFATEPFLKSLDAGEPAAIAAAERWIERSAEAVGRPWRAPRSSSKLARRRCSPAAWPGLRKVSSGSRQPTRRC